jgi:hypothetical protein
VYYSKQNFSTMQWWLHISKCGFSNKWYCLPMFM